MNVERTAELARRVALHAALADPTRLAIVDSLTLGDVSPSQLQDQLGMTSNLLAHHLKVLQDAGVLARTRSEADRRRTYLRLVPGALEHLAPGTVGQASRVVFVCTANSARSQLAAALWRRASDIPAASAGTHPAERIDPGAIAVAHRHDLPLPRRHPRALREVTDGADPADLVVTVCDNAHEEIADGHASDRGGVLALHWSVPDPVRIGTADAFDSAYLDLDRRVGDLAARLTAS